MLGLLPSNQFSVTVRVSKRPLDRLLMSSIITGYTLWNAEYRISLMRNFDISTGNWKRSGFPGESEISEVKREESEGGAGQVDVDCCVEDLESVNLPSLGDLSPKALNYIQQLESELSSAKKARIHSFLEKTKKNILNQNPEEGSDTVGKEQQKLRKKVTILMKKQKVQQVRQIVKRHEDIKPWGQDAQVKVGCRLIQLLMETAYIQPPVDQLGDGPPDIRPTFIHTLKTITKETQKFSRRYGVIECDPLVRKGLEKTELDVRKQENMQMEYIRESNNDLLEYLRSLESDMVTELSRPSSLEVEEIIHQLVQNTLRKFFKDESSVDFMGDLALRSTENLQNGDDECFDTIGTSRDYLAKLLFWCMLLGHHLRGLENRLHLSCAVGLL